MVAVGGAKGKFECHSLRIERGRLILPRYMLSCHTKQVGHLTTYCLLDLADQGSTQNDFATKTTQPVQMV